MPEQQSILCADGHPISLHLFKAKEPKGIVIIGSALGVPEQHYWDFANFLKESDFHCITFSYRGTEDSLIYDQLPHIKLEDWGVQDIEAIIQFAKANNQTEKKILPIHFMGHSIGGQIIGLAQSSINLKTITLIAASAPYWKRWSFPNNIKMFFATQILFPIISSFCNQFPTKRLGLGKVTIPSSAAKKWGEWISKPNYLFDESFQLDTGIYSKLTCSIFSLGFTDDIFAPEVNIEHLLKKFPNASISSKTIDPKAINEEEIGHSGFFKKKFKSNLWQSTLEWLDQSISSKPLQKNNSL